MANLNEIFEAPLSGVKRIIPTEPEVPSAAASLFDTARQGLSVFEQLQTENERRAARTRLEEKEAAQLLGASLAEDVTTSPNISYNPTDPEEFEIALESLGSENYGRQLAALRVARQQGMSETLYRARVDMIEQEIKARYGEQTWVEFNKTLRANEGAKETRRPFFERVATQDAAFQRQQKGLDAAYEAAVQNGFDPNLVGGVEEMYRIGRGILEFNATLARQKANLEILERTGQIDSNRRKILEEDAEREITQAFHLGAGRQFNGIIQTFSNLYVMAANEPENKAKLLQALPVFLQGYQNWRAKVVQEIVQSSPSMAGSKIEALLKPYDDAVKQFSDNVEKDPDRMMGMLRLLQTQHNFSMEQAFPVAMAVRRVLGSTALSQIYIEQMSPEMRDMLLKELNTMPSLLQGSDINPWQRIDRLGLILKGTINLAQLQGKDAQNALADAVKMAPRMTRLLVEDKGELDEATIVATENAIKQIAVAANFTSPSTDLNSLEKLLGAIGSSDTRRLYEALSNRPGKAEGAREMLVASRTGVAQILTALQNSAQIGSGAAAVRFDRTQGRFTVQITDPALKRRLEGGGILSSGLGFGIDIQKAQQAATLANRALDYLISTHVEGGEPVSGTKGEIREFYATGKVPTSAQEQQRQKQNTRDQFDRALQEATEFFGTTPTLSLNTQAEVPDSVASRLIERAEGGAGGVKNPNSSATGIGQFIDSTWIQTVRKHAPEMAANKSAEEILELRKNDNFARMMLERHTEDNAAALRAAGLPANARNRYLAHFLGVDKAIEIIKSEPTTAINEIVGASARSANSSVFRNIKTVEDLLNWAERKMRG